MCQDLEYSARLTSTYLGSISLLGFLHQQATDASFISFHNFNIKATDRQSLANCRDFTRLVDDQARNRCEVICFNLHVEKSLNLSYLGRTYDFITSFSGFYDLVQSFTDYVFVFNLSY